MKNKKALRDLLVIILILIAFPFVLRGGGKLFGLVLVAMIAVATVAMLPFCITLGLLFAGGLQVVSGFSAVNKGIPGGVSTLGVGVLLFVAGVLALIFSIMLYKKAVPWVIRKIRSSSGKKNEMLEENSGEDNERIVE